MTFTARAATQRLGIWALSATLGAGALTMAPAAAAAADPIDGARTSGDPLFPNVGNGGYDAQHYDIALAWTPGATLATSTIAATTTMRATAAAPLRSFSMDFEGLTVESVQVNGAPAAWTRDVDAAAIKHKLIVTPAAPVEGTFTTTVTYSGVPSNHVDADGSFEGWNVTSDGATFLNQPIGAMTGYPHNNTPADKATYRFALDIPTTITNAAGTGPAAAGSNGELVERRPSADGSRTTWVWDQQKPMASELALITIGKYDVLESTITLRSGRTLREWSFVDSALSAANKTTINNRRAQLATIIDGLETIYGPYPGNSVGVVVDTVPGAINYALETQDRSFFPSTNSVAGNTLTHELAHQWYGNAVSPEVWNDIWINEGMATWGPTHYNNVIARTSTTTTETTYFNSWNSRPATHADWTIPPAAMTDSADLYGYQTYTRSAQMWEALKTAIGDPAFFAFVRQWQERYTGQSKGVDEFIALAEEISGRDLTAFFRDWLYDADKPAWPEKLGLALTAAPAAGQVERGDAVTYTLTATNTGRVPLASTVASVDLADVLDDATLDPASLPAGLTLTGTTLTWTVPATALAGTATTTFAVTVDGAARSKSLAATARVETLGGTCTACSTTHTVPSVPTVVGEPAVGETLRAQVDGFPAGTELSHQWLVGGQPVAGATDATYVPTVADLGSTVAVQVTGAGSTLTSAPTAPVAAGTLRETPTPTIAGDARLGGVLRAEAGGWDSGVSLTYQWRVGGAPVAGATGATYRPRRADIGRRVTVTVIGAKPGYRPVSRRSTAAVVAPGVLAPSGRPEVSGTPRVGRTLRADAGSWGPGVSLRYQWYVGGRAVQGATNRTLYLSRAYRGKRVRVAVTGRKAGYTSLVLRSAPTGRVR